MSASLLKKTFLYKLWLKYRIPQVEKKIAKNWLKSGKPAPPPHIIKFNEIKRCRKINNATILIETGTYKGAMLDSCKNLFDKLYSIELDKKLFEEAKAKYKDEQKVININGDSGVELRKLMDKIDKPCLFWLDGHYSGGITAKADIDTPIVEELKAVFEHPIKNHIILIDDARLFVGEDNYPTIDGLKEIVKNVDRSKNLVVDCDIIQIF